jgi:hypothetical protein
MQAIAVPIIIRFCLMNIHRENMMHGQTGNARHALWAA